MEFVHDAWNFMQSFLQQGDYAKSVIQSYQMWIYAVLFLIIFCETGLVVTPFLPGDSLLFATGTFISMGLFDLAIVCVLLCAAAILGDTLNYWIGSLVGPKIFHKENVRLLNKEHLHRAHRFYEKYGGITIILARFMPIIRTFAPFVAGIGKMAYWRFLAYNAIGGIAWILCFTLMGYFFGSQPYVKKNFSLVILAIIIISVMPAVIEYLRQKRKARRDRQAT
jgi:membrane-associated protein